MSQMKGLGKRLMSLFVGNMTCDNCGRETAINYGGANTIACSACYGYEKHSDPVEKKSLEAFSKYYLAELKDSLDGFGAFAGVMKGLFLLLTFMSTGVILVAFVYSEKTEVLFGVAYLAVSSLLFFWFASLGKKFIKLQVEKVENDIHTTIDYRSGAIKMRRELLKQAEKKAQQSITMNGGNAVFAFNGSTVSGVTQTITVEGNGQLVESLALLVSLCEASGQEEVYKMAAQMAEEATREAPDKGLLFDLWVGITSALPTVTGVVKIAQGIKSLFV